MKYDLLLDVLKKQDKLREQILKQGEMANRYISPIIRGIEIDTTSFISRTMASIEKQKKLIDSFLKQDRMVEMFEKITSGIVETEEDINIFKVAMVKLGYPPHYDVDIRKMRMIARDYVENKDQVAEYIDEFMAINYDAEAISEMLIKWEGKPFLDKRIQILRNVVRSHNQGMYHLSVLGIISQYEGIIVDAFNITGHVNGKIQKILLMNLLLQENIGSFRFDKEILDYYVFNILVPFHHGETVISEVSRHAILHGGFANFGKESISLKVILLFDFLVDAIEDLTPESIEEGMKAVEQQRNKKSKK
ncbi:hypothetical protein ACM6Q7_06850 [Peribacillus butanolivorans]|uniref:hypothetical protein n=1 Tax=Peribacillus butanolivorans TaxID=421767 RepID=UPI0039FCED8C